jgi:hypothetical protein
LVDDWLEIREFARLPEVVNAAPLDPGSKVGRVITDPAEAQQIWQRLVDERQITILEHDAVFAELHWSHDGGQGDVPIAWVRSTDGVIRFNLDKFTRPVPPWKQP